MNTHTITLCRPWYQRLFNAVAEGRSQPRRQPAGCDELLNLGRHLLEDIGLHPGQVGSLAAEERQRAQVVRLHSLGGF